MCVYYSSEDSDRQTHTLILMGLQSKGNLRLPAFIHQSDRTSRAKAPRFLQPYYILMASEAFMSIARITFGFWENYITLPCPFPWAFRVAASSDNVAEDHPFTSSDTAAWPSHPPAIHVHRYLYFF